MNKIITSEEQIIEGSREFISRQGLKKLDMRSLASFLQVSVGTIYNYFPSKEALMEASVEAVFKDIFHARRSDTADFLSLLSGLAQALEAGERKYPGFFAAHSFAFSKEGKEEAREMKKSSILHVQLMMKEALEKDKKVRPDAFTDLDEDQFIDLVFLALLNSFSSKKNEIGSLEEMVRRTIY
jgi:AcrR family transcriptional regulator